MSVNNSTIQIQFLLVQSRKQKTKLKTILSSLKKPLNLRKDKTKQKLNVSVLTQGKQKQKQRAAARANRKRKLPHAHPASHWPAETRGVERTKHLLPNILPTLDFLFFLPYLAQQTRAVVPFIHTRLGVCVRDTHARSFSPSRLVFFFFFLHTLGIEEEKKRQLCSEARSVLFCWRRERYRASGRTVFLCVFVDWRLDILCVKMKMRAVYLNIVVLLLLLPQGLAIKWM